MPDDNPAEIMATDTEALITDLLIRCAQGDRQAFAKLYRHASPRLYSLALRILRRRDWAEDVLQDCFITIWRQAEAFRPDRGPGLAWMAAILRNRAIDWLRRADRLREEDEEMADTQEPPGEDGPMEKALASATLGALRECMAQLKAVQRQVIAFAYYHGLTHEEVAHRLGQPLGTVKSWIRRGLDELRKCLAL